MPDGHLPGGPIRSSHERSLWCSLFRLQASPKYMEPFALRQTIAPKTRRGAFLLAVDLSCGWFEGHIWSSPCGRWLLSARDFREPADARDPGHSLLAQEGLSVD